MENGIREVETQRRYLYWDTQTSRMPVSTIGAAELQQEAFVHRDLGLQVPKKPIKRNLGSSRGATACPAGLVLCGFQMCLNASLKGFGGPRQQRNGMLVLLALAFASRSRCNSYELAEQVVTAAHTVDRPTPNISAAPEKFTC